MGAPALPSTIPFSTLNHAPLAAVHRTAHSNNSQFYVTLEALPWLDGKKVAFGQVVEGMRVLRVLEKAETNERPNEKVTIRSCAEIKAD